MAQYMQIASIIGNSLPKVSDPTLLEIDDILYKDANVDDTNAFAIDSSDVNTVLSSECLLLFVETYGYFMCNTQATVNIVLETTILQLLEHSPDAIYYETRLYCKLLSYFRRLMVLKNTGKVCLALKMLKIALVRNKDVITKYIEGCDISMKFLFWMLKLQNVPEPNLPEQKRVSAWLRQQSAIVVRMIDLKTFKFRRGFKRYLDDFTIQQDDNYVLIPQERFDVEFVKRWNAYNVLYVPFSIDLIYSYFMSAKDEEEKIQRLKDFLLGISPHGSWPLEMSDDGHYLVYYNDGPKKLQTRGVVYQCYLFIRALEFRILLRDKMYSDDILRDMEEKYGCDVKPYFSEDKNLAFEGVAEESKSYLKDEETNNPKLDSKNDVDYTIENFIFFDDFVKKLQVLNIVHTAFMMCQELLKTEGDIVGYDSLMFSDYYVKECLRYKFFNPSSVGDIPWLIDVLLRKCPFMILPKRHEYLLHDFKKMLKGEDIDELIKEELYFLLFKTTELTDQITVNKSIGLH